MSTRTAAGSSKPLGRPLGTGRDWRRRVLFHHVLLAVASGVVLVLFMGLSPFATGGWPRMEMVGSSPFPTAMDMGDYFVTRDGSVLLNSFGLGNWTGLAAIVIVVGLLAIPTDRSIRELKAKRWKNLQRMNYALFALVVLHAFLYGALLRMASPFTLVLIITVTAVLAGQLVGIWLWRRRLARAAANRHERQPAGTTP